MMQILRVELGDRSYPIHIGAGVLARAGEILRPALPAPRAVVVTDENVAAAHFAALQQSLIAGDIQSSHIVLPSGESSKNFAQLESLTRELLRRSIDRKTTVIALGGGVVGDITGFAASMVLRGVPFMQIPTTLLAQVDSAVGGKTAINTPEGKNLIGAFYQPCAVLADTGVLATLPLRHMRAGYAEIVKYGLINDPMFFEWLEGNASRILAHDADALSHAIATSCAAKAAIVGVDERESGDRALLNLGHTFGHALEAETGFGDALLHGEAVAIGMVMALDFSAHLGLCPAEVATRVKTHLAALGFVLTPPPIASGWDAETIITRMRGDKKTENGALTLILARGIGAAFVEKNIEEAALRQWITEYMKTWIRH